MTPRPYHAEAITFEAVKVILEELSLSEAIDLVGCLHELGDIDHIITPLVRYLYDRADVEHLLDSICWGNLTPGAKTAFA